MSGIKRGHRVVDLKGIKIAERDVIESLNAENLKRDGIINTARK